MSCLISSEPGTDLFQAEPPSPGARKGRRGHPRPNRREEVSSRTPVTRSPEAKSPQTTSWSTRGFTLSTFQAEPPSPGARKACAVVAPNETAAVLNGFKPNPRHQEPGSLQDLSRLVVSPASLHHNPLNRNTQLPHHPCGRPQPPNTNTAAPNTQETRQNQINTAEFHQKPTAADHLQNHPPNRSAAAAQFSPKSSQIISTTYRPVDPPLRQTSSPKPQKTASTPGLPHNTPTNLRQTSNAPQTRPTAPAPSAPLAFHQPVNRRRRPYTARPSPPSHKGAIAALARQRSRELHQLASQYLVKGPALAAPQRRGS